MKGEVENTVDPARQKEKGVLVFAMTPLNWLASPGGFESNVRFWFPDIELLQS